jgi:hypothetical protein
VREPVGVLEPVGVRDPEAIDDLEPNDDLELAAERVEVADFGVELTRPGLRDRPPVGVIVPVGVREPVGVVRPFVVVDRVVEVGVLRPVRDGRGVSPIPATVPRRGVEVRKPGKITNSLNERFHIFTAQISR